MKYPIYPITFSYVSGIFCSLYTGLSLQFALVFGVIALLLFGFFILMQYNKGFHKNYNFFTLIAVCSLFIALGFTFHRLANKKIEVQQLNETEFTVKTIRVLKSNSYSHRIYADLISHPQLPTVLVTFSNKQKTPKVGEVYKIVGSIKEVPYPRNPYDFDYKNYLKQKNIHYQIASYYPAVLIRKEHSVISKIADFRSLLMEQFSKMGYADQTKGFIEALLFGVKNNLDTNLQNQFKDFGIMHILAVSGLHVLILFSTLNYILKQMRVPAKLILLVLVLFLVLFSFMAGLAGSVVRASLMCILVLFGTVFERRVITYNILASSMLLILLVAPNYLFDIGFQLSYAAVFSIIFCFPVIQRFFTFNNPIINYFTQLIGISLVAQLGILPISVYYFNQVPILFLLGNLIAVPIATALLTSWFVQLIVSFIWLKTASYGTIVLEFASNLCFDTLAKLNTLFPMKAFDVHFSSLQAITAFLFVMSVFWYFQKKENRKILLSMCLLISFQLASIQKVYRNNSTSELVLVADRTNVIFLNRSGTCVAQIGNASPIVHSSIKNYLLHNGIKQKKIDSLSNSFTINNKSWLIVDSLAVYPNKKIDYLVLYQNAKVNIERLIDYTQPKQVILHSSNYAYLNEEYAAYLKKIKIPYHDMRNKGSFNINYNSDNN